MKLTLKLFLRNVENDHRLEMTPTEEYLVRMRALDNLKPKQIINNRNRIRITRKLKLYVQLCGDFKEWDRTHVKCTNSN